MLMKNSPFYYSVGALLYCPANNTGIVDSILEQKFDNGFSLAFCLEDTIPEKSVPEAETILIHSLFKIAKALDEQDFYLPKIFIRVRNPIQILRLYRTLGSEIGILTGFIIPKFSLENADTYINTMIAVNANSKRLIYMMPIYESASLIDLRTRHRILYTLKEKLSQIEKIVLNIRVGGNDLCHLFGFRRHDNESIHSLKPISSIFSDIVTVYGSNYVISAPVWEYYDGENWKQGLINELAGDKLCGFIGKTAIHPKQIEVINQSYKVLQKDLEDAISILNWNGKNDSLVSANPSKERMNEYKTHFNWARQTLFMAKVFGIK